MTLLSKRPIRLSLKPRFIVKGTMPPWTTDVYLMGHRLGRLDWRDEPAGVPSFSTASSASEWAMRIGASDYEPVPHIVVPV